MGSSHGIWNPRVTTSRNGRTLIGVFGKTVTRFMYLVKTNVLHLMRWFCDGINYDVLLSDTSFSNGSAIRISRGTILISSNTSIAVVFRDIPNEKNNHVDTDTCRALRLGETPCNDMTPDKDGNCYAPPPPAPAPTPELLWLSCLSCKIRHSDTTNARSTPAATVM
jgi:hypothetical protein